MFKRMMMGFAAFGVIAVLATEASAACTWVKTSTGAYRLYGTCSIVCDLAFQGGSAQSIIGCSATINDQFPVLLLCSNGGGTIAPGGNVVLTEPVTITNFSSVTFDRRRGISAAVITLELVTPDPANNRGCVPGDERSECVLDQACKDTFNDNWFAVNAVPCATTNLASLNNPTGSDETFEDTCRLEVKQCDPTGTLGYTDNLTFNKKTGEFEKTFYACEETDHFRTN